MNGMQRFMVGETQLGPRLLLGVYLIGIVERYFTDGADNFWLGGVAVSALVLNAPVIWTGRRRLQLALVFVLLLASQAAIVGYWSTVGTAANIVTSVYLYIVAFLTTGSWDIACDLDEHADPSRPSPHAFPRER